jgi:hypothetical protein
MDAVPSIALVTMTDIAAMAKVRRPVVSTWRRRYADFPQPVAAPGASPRFHGREVVDWLVSTGLGKADAGDLRAELALHTLVSAADWFGPRELVETISALLCLRHFAGTPLVVEGATPRTSPVREGDSGDGTDPERIWDHLMARAERLDAEDGFLLRELRAAGSPAVPLIRLCEDLVEAAFSPAAAHEWLLAARARLGLTELTADAVAPDVLGLLIGMLGLPSRSGDRPLVIADPHGGSGDLLASAARAVVDPGRTVMLGADPREWLARLARRRLLLTGVNELGLDVQVGTEVEERLADADLIVTHLPYIAGESRDAHRVLAQVEQVADLLGPGCTGVVLGPAEALVDRLRDRSAVALRAQLLGSGVVEAVLTLPGGVLRHRPGYRTAVWVLTRDPVPSAVGYVLLTDLGPEPLSDGLCARAAEDVVLWRTEGLRRDGHDPRYGRVVPVADLVARPGEALTPPGPPSALLLARTVGERAAMIADVEGLLERRVDDAVRHAEQHGALRTLVVHRTGPPPVNITIRALLATGRLSKLPGHHIRPADVGPDGHHRVLGPQEILDRALANSRWIDRAVLAAGYERVGLTEPGDIVYTLAPRLGVLVDEDGFSVVAFPAQALRVNPQAARPLRPRALAALIAESYGTARALGAVRAVKRIEDYTIPDLADGDSDRFDALLGEIDHRRALLWAQDDALRDVRRLAAAGFTDGTLTIGQP